MDTQPNAKPPADEPALAAAARHAEALATHRRELWDDVFLPDIGRQIVVLATLVGDLARTRNDVDEGHPFDCTGYRRALGELLLTAARYATEAGAADCLELAVEARRDFLADLR